MNDIDKLDTTQLVVFWNKLDDHFDTGLLSDEDAEDINKTIQALIDRECNKARIDELIGVRGWTEYEPDPKYSPAERFHIVPYTYLTKRIDELKRSKE
jgi:hypothetical protein